MKIARVALDVPLEQAFDFRVPEGLDPPRGSLVVVPFGRASKVGVVVARPTRTDVPDERLRELAKVVDDVAPLAERDFALLEFCASYYHRPLGEVIQASLPPRLRQARRRRHQGARRPTPPAEGPFDSPVDATPEQSAALDAHPRGLRALPSGAPRRHHRQRQDRGLPAAHRGGARPRAAGALPRAGDRPHAAARGARARPLPGRFHRGRAQPPRRGRARGGVARGAIGPGAHRAGHAARRAVADAGARAHRRRRGARPFLQAARGASLLGEGRRRPPRADGGDPGGAGLGHAVARDLGQRAAGPLRARGAQDARPRGGDAAGRAHGGHARRQAGRGRDRRAAARAQGAPREGRAEPRVPQSPRLLARALLPLLRVALDLRPLQREPRPAHEGGRAALPPLRAPRSACRRAAPGAEAPTWRPWATARSASRRRSRRRCPARASCASTATPPRARAPSRRCWARCATRRSTSSWARRCSPRATTTRGSRSWA